MRRAARKPKKSGRLCHQATVRNDEPISATATTAKNGSTDSPRVMTRSANAAIASGTAGLANTARSNAVGKGQASHSNCSASLESSIGNPTLSQAARVRRYRHSHLLAVLLRPLRQHLLLLPVQELQVLLAEESEPRSL